MRDLDGMRICSSMYYQPDSILEKLIYPFKYKHQASIFRIFVPQMEVALRLLMEPENILLVPVPLHKKRKLKRGYNQAELLAVWVGKRLGCPVVDFLERVKDTSKQSHLKTSEERVENMKNAFKVIRDPPNDMHIVLVDDIVTTGSTLLACRDALKAAGAYKISSLTLADREKKPQNPWN